MGKLSNLYLYYYLKYRIKDIEKLGSGTTFKELSKSSLEGFVVNIHDKNNQELIAKILSDIDDKIELNNKINIELEKIAKELYYYWFVQFDFPDEKERPYKSSGGAMIYNKDLKREIPVGWEVKKLSDIANITMGQSPDGKSYNIKNVGLPFHQGCANFGDKYPIAEQFTTEPSRIANTGDCLLSVRAPVGSLNIAIEKCCIGRGLAAINSKTDDNEYIYNILLDLKHKFNIKNSVGTTFGAITKDELFNILVIKPDDKTLAKFKEKSRNATYLQLRLFQENLHLASLRDYILPLLMNGQVTINS